MNVKITKKNDIVSSVKKLSERLDRLEAFLKNNNGISDDRNLFTEENVKKVIALLNKIDPLDKNLINCFKRLLPLTKLSSAELRARHRKEVVSNKKVSGGKKLQLLKSKVNRRLSI